MNLQEMTNEQLMGEFGITIAHMPPNKHRLIIYCLAIETEHSLCAPKQPYQIKYKFLPNDRDIDDMKALAVWGTSLLTACQTLVDANDWRGQSMEFQVNEYHFTSDDLE